MSGVTSQNSPASATMNPITRSQSLVYRQALRHEPVDKPPASGTHNSIRPIKPATFRT